MAPQQSAWVNPQSQFASTAQGYTTSSSINPYVDYSSSNTAANTNTFVPIRYYQPTSQPQQGQPQQNAPAGNLMSSDGLSNAFQLGKFAKNGFQLPQNQLVNSFGSQLGFMNPALQGPTTAAYGGAPLGSSAAAQGASVGASASSVLGAAGIGALAGSFLGKIGGNSTGGMIGGALGAGAGMAGVFSSIGMAGGPIGAVAGGLIGGIAGGFFGGKKIKHPEGAMRNVAIDPTGVASGGTFSGKHVDPGAYNPIISDFSNYLQKQAKKYNIQYANNPAFYIGSSSGNWSHYGGNAPNMLITYTGDAWGESKGGQKEFFDWNDKAQRTTAYEKAFNNILKLSNIDASTLKPMNETGGQIGGTIIKQRTQGSFDEFMKRYNNGNTNVQP